MPGQIEAFEGLRALFRALFGVTRQWLVVIHHSAEAF